MPDPVKDWSDFDWFLNTYLPAQLVATLKSIGTFLEAAGGIYLGIKSQERKDHLVEKIRVGFREMQRKQEFEKYRGVRMQAEQIGKPVRQAGYGVPIQAPTFGGVPSGPRYAPPAGPSRPGWAPAAPTRVQHTLQDWKPNPMFKAIKAVTSMELLPDINTGEGSHAHRDKRLTFYLAPDVVEKLQSSRSNPAARPQYSLRIFCTSGDYYRPPGAPQTGYVSNRDIPIDFPSNPDVTFGGAPMMFKERGLRGKPGSAPPFDLGKVAFALNSDRLHTLNFGHTGPTPSKKKDQAKRFFFQICLAEITNKEALLDRLLQLPTLSAEESLAAARRQMDDDDIVADSFKLSLKDPLAYMRISRPVRSTKCTHIQCFDPRWWIEGNALHPQFLCPLCSKPLQFEDLIIDGFFQSILDAVPDSVDEVILDASFDWKSDDGKYSSKQAPKPPSPVAPPSPDPSRQPTPKTEGKRKAIEVLSSDDDEDDVPLSNTYRPTPAASTSAAPSNDVIDLTLDDSDEETDHFREPSTGRGRSVSDQKQSIPPPKLPEIDLGARLDSLANYRKHPPKYRDPHRLPEIDISPFDMNIDGMTQGSSFGPAYSVDRWSRPHPDSYPSYDRPYDRYAPTDRWEDPRANKRHRPASEWSEDYRSRNDPYPR